MPTIGIQTVLCVFNLVIDPLLQFQVSIFFAFNKFKSMLLNVDIAFVLFYMFVVNFSVTSAELISYNISNVIINLSSRFVNYLISQNLHFFRTAYFTLVYNLFLFIFLSNNQGLSPFAWTLTNSFIITFYLSFTYFFIINFWTWLERKWKFGGQFFNSSIPFEISPILVPVELVSHVSKTISLSVRLFANVSSGHSLLKILIGFSWILSLKWVQGITMIMAFGVLLAFSAPWTMVSAIFVLENLIACLQSYVFCILLLIYTNDLSIKH